METTFLHLKRPWPEIRERIKEQNIELTDGDLDLKPGREDEMLQNLMSKLHMSKEEIKIWIESLAENDAQAG